MSRIAPLTGTDEMRQAMVAAGRIGRYEIHTTDNRRIFFGGKHLGPAWLGDVASEAAMLALNATHERKCFPGDHCQRTDIGQVMLCIANRGQHSGDWISVGGSVAAISVSYDNASAGLSATNVQDAIDELAGRPSDIRDGWLFG